MTQTQRQTQQAMRREDRRMKIMGMEPRARREFALELYQAANSRAEMAVRMQRKHTKITPEDMVAFAVAQAEFEAARDERNAALELLDAADQHEVLVRFPLREKYSLELEMRLVRYTEKQGAWLTFGVTEWDMNCYRGRVIMTLTPEAMEKDGDTVDCADVLNGAIRAMCFDERGQVYTCQVEAQSESYFEARLTSVIGLHEGVSREEHHAGNDVSDCAGSGDAQGVGAD